LPETGNDTAVTTGDVLPGRVLFLVRAFLALLLGVVGLFMVILAVFLPGTTAVLVVKLFAGYALLDGLLSIAVATRAVRRALPRALTTLEGLVGIGTSVAAFVLISAYADRPRGILTLIVAWAMATGALQMVWTFSIEIARGRAILAATAALSLAFGVLLLGWRPPDLIGAVWRLAMFALFLGILRLVVMFRLQGPRGPEAPVPREARLLRATILAAPLAVLLVAAGCASMQEAPRSVTLDRIKASKTVTFGHRKPSVLPFSFVGADGKPSGYSVDLCHRVAADLKRELQLPDLIVKWMPVTVESRVRAVQDGTIDLECGSTTNTLSRQMQVDFSLTTFVTGGSLLALRETTRAQLRELRVAVIPGTTTEGALKEGMAKTSTNVQLVAVKDHAEGRLAIENGTADTYASDREILIGLALTAPEPGRFVLVDRYFSYEPYALMLRRGDPDFRLAVNRALARLYRSGDIVEIYRRWLGALGVPGALEVATWAIEGLPE
jgi:ABC-type amino acid transport substrate-binding protein/uncharacterized membrane protein HdeD (DUF308 family)